MVCPNSTSPVESEKDRTDFSDCKFEAHSHGIVNCLEEGAKYCIHALPFGYGHVCKLRSDIGPTKDQDPPVLSQDE